MKTIEERFYQDEFQEILRLSIDAKDGTLKEADLPFVVGALTFLARLEEADVLFRDFAPRLNADQRVTARFFLSIAHARHFKFQVAQDYLIANARERRALQDPRARFYIAQGLGFYHYTYGHLQKALIWSSKAHDLALLARFHFGRVLAADLKAHVVIGLGQIRMGIRQMEDLRTLARQLSLENVIDWSSISHALYSSNFGLLGPSAVEHLEQILATVAITDSFSRASILLEISRQQILMGQADQAKLTLDLATKDVYQVDNIRLEILLNLRLGGYLYSRGEFYQALNLIRNSICRMKSCQDKTLEQKALGFERKLTLLLGLEKDREAIDQRLLLHKRKYPNYLSGRILDRDRGIFAAQSIRGQDPLGDTLDLIRMDSPEALKEVLANRWYGLLYTMFGISESSTVLFLDIERSGSLSCFEMGNVDHYSKPTTPLIRKLFESLSMGEKSKEQIVADVWGYVYHPDRHNNLVYNLVGTARKHLEGKASWIEATDLGYRLRPGVALRQRFEEFGTQNGVAVDAPKQESVSSDLNFRQKSAIKRIANGHDFDLKTYQVWFEVSEATATRDLRSLAEMGLLRRVGKARSTRYSLVQDITT